jgi:hypothetical protein
VTGELLFIFGAIKTLMGPEVAPVGTVMLMEVLAQDVIAAGVPFTVTILVPCKTPKPTPDI